MRLITNNKLIIVICIAFIDGKYCDPQAIGYVKIWPSSTKSLPIPALKQHFEKYIQILTHTFSVL